MPLRLQFPLLLGPTTGFSDPPLDPEEEPLLELDEESLPEFEDDSLLELDDESLPEFDDEPLLELDDDSLLDEDEVSLPELPEEELPEVEEESLLEDDDAELLELDEEPPALDDELDALDEPSKLPSPDPKGPFSSAEQSGNNCASPVTTPGPMAPKNCPVTPLSAHKSICTSLP